MCAVKRAIFVTCICDVRIIPTVFLGLCTCIYKAVLWVIKDGQRALLVYHASRERLE